jgi:heme-degrading monooxygenase HmoA
MADCLDEEGQTFVWITYWKDLKGLHEFSNNSVHRLGIKAYRDDKMFPYVGIMHETYYCQTKSRETLYNDFPPFGLGECLKTRRLLWFDCLLV